MLQGWFAAINRQPAGAAQLTAYPRFHTALKDLQKLTVLPFDADAVVRFEHLCSLRLRVGTMDLKIAPSAS